MDNKQIKNNKWEEYIMKKQIIALLTVGLISLSGILVFANNKSSITKMM